MKLMDVFFGYLMNIWNSYPASFAEKKCEIDKLAEEYITNVRNLAPDQRVEHLQKIQNGFSKCKEYSDDKVQLAMQTYEMVSAGDPRLSSHSGWKPGNIGEF